MNIQANLQSVIEVVKNIIPLREAYLFGSYAYGQPNQDSDFDIYLVADSIDGNHHEKLVAIYGAIHGVAGKPTDVLLNTKENFDYRKGNTGTLEYKVVKDGVKLYG